MTIKPTPKNQINKQANSCVFCATHFVLFWCNPSTQSASQYANVRYTLLYSWHIGCLFLRLHLKIVCMICNHNAWVHDVLVYEQRNGTWYNQILSTSGAALQTNIDYSLESEQRITQFARDGYNKLLRIFCSRFIVTSWSYMTISVSSWMQGNRAHCVVTVIHCREKMENATIFIS